MVWAGITSDGRTHHYILVRGIVNVVRHRDEVLEPYVCRFTVGPDFVSMNDKARQSRGEISEDIRRMDCTVRSSNLIRIEHAEEALGRVIESRDSPTRTIQGLNGSRQSC
ncbi:transposable element Tcb2 transposase [Trichonephila clavipes]|nr:transposable element Tcb2 transposase [Trichonephila clavipes]